MPGVFLIDGRRELSMAQLTEIATNHIWENGFRLVEEEPRPELGPVKPKTGASMTVKEYADKVIKMAMGEAAVGTDNLKEFVEALEVMDKHLSTRLAECREELKMEQADK